MYNKLKVCILLYGLSVVISFATLWMLGGVTDVRNLDEDELYYYVQAERLATNTYFLDSYRPIGYPAILSVALKVTNLNVLGSQILMVMFSSLSSPLLYLFVLKTTNHQRASLLSGILLSLWPTHIFYSFTFYSQTAALPLFLLFLLLLPHGGSQSKWFRWGMSGLVLGSVILIHPMYLVFIPFAVWIVFLERTTTMQALRRTLILIGMALFTIAPWSVVSTLNEGSFVLLSKNSADALAGGLNQQLLNDGYQLMTTSKGRTTWIGPGMWTFEHGYLSNEEVQLPSNQRNTLLFKRTFEWIASHPGGALYLQVAKLANIWGIYPMWWVLKKRTFFGNIPLLIVLVFAGSALVRWRNQWRRLCRYWTIPLFVCCVALLSCGSWRYRHPADPMLLALASMAFYGAGPRKDLSL